MILDQAVSSRGSIRSGCSTMSLRRSFLLGQSASPYVGPSHCTPICNGCLAMEASSNIIMVIN